MGTTLEKVQAAQASKEDCFDAIVEMGGTITTSTKFADYGDAIRSIPAGEIPETTAESTHVITGKTFVRNVDGEPVLTTGNMPSATFYEQNYDIKCGTAGYTEQGAIVYQLDIPTPASFAWTFDSTYARLVCTETGVTEVNSTVTAMTYATYENTLDGNIKCTAGGYANEGTILTMNEPSGQVITGGSSSATLSFNTPGWVGTYTTFSLNNAGFTATPDYSGNLDIICGTAGYTDSGTTVTTISGATMSMDYSGGTVFSGEGYASNETLVLEPSTMSVSGATVYATQGYQNGTQYTEVQSGTVTETDSTIEISEGYVQAGTYSKGGGGYPVPSGEWTTQMIGYYGKRTSGEKGTFLRVNVGRYFIGSPVNFILYVNEIEFLSFSGFIEEGDLYFTNVVFYIPPNSEYYATSDGSFWSLDYSDATMQN